MSDVIPQIESVAPQSSLKTVTAMTKKYRRLWEESNRKLEAAVIRAERLERELERTDRVLDVLTNALSRSIGNHGAAT